MESTNTRSCMWCALKLQVPVDAQTVKCPRCQVINQFVNKLKRYIRAGSYPAVYGNANQNGYTFEPASSPGYGSDYNKPAATMNYGYYVQPLQVSSHITRPPALHARQKAVLCGISYRGHAKSLKGSVNDVLSMRNLLVERMGFPQPSVLILTEDENDPYRIPTKRNIRAALRWLVQGCQAGDSLVFYYSGHASQIRDRDGDEIDGHDEALCPVDYETEGRILDDEINATIVRPLVRGVALHAIIDTCFSGTFLDLPFLCRINSEGYYMWEDHRVPYAAYKGTGGGLAISISACDDHQTSGDTTAFTGRPSGALTYAFTQTMENEAKLTYGQLLMAMRNKISKAQKAVGFSGSKASEIQEPQLSCSDRFDIHSKRISF